MRARRCSHVHGRCRDRVEGPPLLSATFRESPRRLDDVVQLEPAKDPTRTTPKFIEMLLAARTTANNYPRFPACLDAWRQDRMQPDPWLYGRPVEPFLGLQVEMVRWLVVTQGEVAVVMKRVRGGADEAAHVRAPISSWSISAGIAASGRSRWRTGQVPDQPRLRSRVFRLDPHAQTGPPRFRRRTASTRTSSRSTGRAGGVRVPHRAPSWQIHVPTTQGAKVIRWSADDQPRPPRCLQSAVGHPFRNTLQDSKRCPDSSRPVAGAEGCSSRGGDRSISVLRTSRPRVL